MDDSGQNANPPRREGRTNLPRPAAHEPSATHPVTLLIVEDSPIVRERLVAMIACVPGVVIVGQAQDGHQAQQLFQQHRPDAVVLDLQLPGIGGVDLLIQFKRSHPACVVMVLTTFCFLEVRQRCINLGADYFFEKAREFERVMEVLGTLKARREAEESL